MNILRDRTYIEEVRAIYGDGANPIAAAIAMSLINYRPAMLDETPDCPMTSAELVNHLEDIVNVTVNEVTAVMVRLGYTLHSGEQNLTWNMTARDTADKR